jgi:hypothetical protein
MSEERLYVDVIMIYEFQRGTNIYNSTTFIIYSERMQNPFQSVKHSTVNLNEVILTSKTNHALYSFLTLMMTMYAM